METLPVIRNLVRELRLITKSHKLGESPAFKYIMQQARKHAVSQEQICKAKEEMLFNGQTYLSYLRSTRKAAELRHEYNGRGERTVNETAGLVGFKLPHDPK